MTKLVRFLKNMHRYYSTIGRLTLIFVSAISIFQKANNLGLASIESEHAGQIELVSVQPDHVVLELDIPAYTISTESIDRYQVDKLAIPGLENIYRNAELSLPVISTLLGIPAEAELELTIIQDEVEIESRRLRLSPKVVPARLDDDLVAGTLIFGATDKQAIDQTAEFDVPVQIAGIAWVRDKRVARIEFKPFRYDSQDEKLTWHKRIRVQIEFSQVSSVNTDQQTTSSGPSSIRYGDSWVESLQQSLINPEYAAAHRSIPRSQVQANLEIPDFMITGGPAYRVELEQDGIYEITYSQLLTAGMDVANLDPTLLNMNSQGEDIAIYVENLDGDEHIFSPGESVRFFGQKFNGEKLALQYASEANQYLSYPAHNPDGSTMIWQPEFNAEMLEKYTDTNVYWLYIGATPGLRMQVVDGTPTNSAPIPYSYSETVRAEESIYWYTHNFTSEDTWYWEDVITTAQRVYTTTLSALATLPFTATIRGEIAARGSSAAYNPDHHTKLWINNRITPIDDAYWDGISRYHFEAEVPSSDLNEGDNWLKLGMFLDAYPGQPTDRLYFDWFEVSYPRRFVANDDQITYERDESGNPWQYEIDGFVSTSAQVMNITDPFAPVLISGVMLTSGNLAFEADNNGMVRYYIVGTNQVRSPTEIAFYQPPTLLSTSNQYDYVFITNELFIPNLQFLVNYRANQGLSTLVVNIDDVYNLFNYGIIHSIAIKNFLAYTLANWSVPPMYALLVGDGHWNFKGYGDFNNPEIYIPPHLSWVDPWQGEVDSTNLLAAVIGDDPIPDVHIGRLPVNSPAELNAAIFKTIGYEQADLGDWQRQVIFVAENVPDPAGDFMAASELIINDYIPSDYGVNRIYQNNYNCTIYPCPLVNYAITSTLNTTGAQFLNFTGHASLNRWSKESVFINANIASLYNGNKLPVILSLTCLDGYWIHPGMTPNPAPGLIEDMVRAEAKGAVGAFSPTGLGVATGHDALARGFYDSVFDRGNWSLAEATLSARMRLFASGENLDLINTYLIFGDPALRMNNPYEFQVTPVDNEDTVLPGSVVEFSINLTNTGLVADSFRVSLENAPIWPVTFSQSVDPLQPGEDADLVITVYTPLYAPDGVSDIVNLEITSDGDGNDVIPVTLTTTIHLPGEQLVIYLPQIVK